MNFFQELRRRNVVKVATVYIVTAWLLMQVGAVVFPAFEAPTWIMKTLLVLLLFGFVVALILAWAFEVTPDGIKREADIAPEDSVKAHSGRKLDFIIIALLIIVAGYFIYESRFTSQPIEPVVTDDMPTKALPQEPTPEVQGTSIAVLPFVNMSSDKEQEYFSDGISEEILNVLAQIPKLHVTSRTSSFFYKGTKINVADVAKKLGVNNILEGSVRKSGNTIRITAQLIEADTDKHLWSETYDRELTDIFAVQDEISAAIVDALKLKLGLDVKVAARDMSNINLDAHNEYLQGRFYLENRNQADLERALAHFDKAVEISPEYAPAWMGKAWASFYLGENRYGNTPTEASMPAATTAIAMALKLDPALAEIYVIMGMLEGSQNNDDKALIHFQKAIELNPNFADAISMYGDALDYQPKKQLALTHKAVQLSPMSILTNVNYAKSLMRFGKTDESRVVAEHMLTINPLHRFSFSILARTSLIEGKYAQAIVAYDSIVKHAPKSIDARFSVADRLADIGLGELAASYLEGTEADGEKYMLTGNKELFFQHYREFFPRSEDDSLGFWVRGRAEIFAENYSEANKYFKLSNKFSLAFERIYAHLQSGEIEEAEALLNRRKLLLKAQVDAGVKFIVSGEPVSINAMDIAYSEGDVDAAINHLRKAVDQNYIVGFWMLVNPMYKALMAHPQWPEILEKSNKHAAKERELYFKLIGKEDNAASL